MKPLKDGNFAATQSHDPNGPWERRVRAAERQLPSGSATISMEALEQLQSEMLPERWYRRMDHLMDGDINEIEEVAARRRRTLRQMC
jgi:hypothetical protein